MGKCGYFPCDQTLAVWKGTAVDMQMLLILFYNLMKVFNENLNSGVQVTRSPKLWCPDENVIPNQNADSL